MIARRLRKAILQAAIEGKLSEQLKEDGDSRTYEELLKEERAKIIKEKKYRNNCIVATNLIEDYPLSIPDNWALFKLNDLVYLLGDGLHGTPEYDLLGDYFFINGNNLNDGKIVIKPNTKKINIEIYYKYKKDLNESTVLVSINGTIGNVAFYNYENIVLGKSASYFNLLSFIDKKYMKYLINTEYFLKYAINNATGSTIKNVSLKTMRNFIVPLPPLAEQKRIVEKLDEILPMIDALEEDEIKVKDSTTKFPDNMKASILQAAIEGKLTEQYFDDRSFYDILDKNLIINQEEPFDVPDNWLFIKLGDVCRIKNGSTPKKSKFEYWNSNDVPWFTVKDIHNQGRVISATEKYITFAALGEGKRIIPKNSVLLCCTASLGEYAYTNIDLTTNQQFNGITVLEKYKDYLDPLYIYYWVQTLKKQMIEQAGKTTFPFLSTKKLGAFLLPIPPIEEQQRIVKKLEQLLPIMDELRV